MTWLFTGDISPTIRRRSATELAEPRSSVALIVTSPPDLSEVERQSWKELFELYEVVFRRCEPCLQPGAVVAIVVTDRKWRGSIVRKHQAITRIAESLDRTLFLHKVVVRSTSPSLYRLGFSHLLCFRRSKEKPSWRGRKWSREFRTDVWGPFDEAERLPAFRNGFPPQVARLLIEAFTSPGDRVLDPFCGSGRTQRVALGLKRKAVGYEVDSEMEAFWGCL